eukprot:Skav204395  [mRNA]  locus=scaffold2947:164542:176525:+ [translate_table: standard]
MDGRWDVSLHDLRAVYDPEMHIAMLQDSSRHRFYAQCLLKHQDDFKDKVAVDIGAGVGIMSALAVVHGKLGHVHAERSKITVHCGFAEQFCATPGWPADEVALVVSATWVQAWDWRMLEEWLGILALNEGMAQPLLRCRDALCHLAAKVVTWDDMAMAASICMSIPEADPAIVELSLTFSGLQVTVRGPLDQAARFVERVSALPREVSPSSSRPSAVASPGLRGHGAATVSSAASSVSGTGETRASILASFDPCPPHLLQRASRNLGGSQQEAHLRATRAWVAGNWAKAVVEGRVSSPNRTPSIDLQNRFWAVARASTCIPLRDGGSHLLGGSWPSSLSAQLKMESNTCEVSENYTVHVIDIPPGMDEAVESNVALALVILKRHTGMLLAVPTGFFSEEALAAGLTAGPDDQIGQSTTLALPAGEKFDLAALDQPQPLEDAFVAVVLVDVSNDMAQFLSPYGQEHDVDTCMPSIRTTRQRVAFYSADEGVENGGSPVAVPLPPKRRAAPSSKGGSSGGDGGEADRLHCGPKQTLRQPLGSSNSTGSLSAAAAPSELVKLMPPPTRSMSSLHQSPVRPRVSFASMEEAKQLQQEKQETEESGDLAKAIYAQSHALTTSVQHLASTDPLQDLASSSSSSISSKGSQGRMRLQQEVAMQRGTFFQSVLQQMARRMQPTRIAEQSPAELSMRGITPTSYLERYGGYGKLKDIGCFQWQICLIMEHLQHDNINAAKDGNALLAVCLEQTALDQGRTDVGLLLSLTEEPPAGVFTNRSLPGTFRGRPFAPMADQRWITTTLAYIREMDLINSRRLDATSSKTGDKDQPEKDPQKPNPKKTPKKHPKGGGKQRGKTSATIVFPLPLADFGLFSGGGPKLPRRRCATLLRKRLLHLVIVALNYLEGCLNYETVHLLGRRPNAVQRSIHARLRSLVAMCDSPSIASCPVVPGRSGPEFIARLFELEQFAETEELLSVEHYASGPQDFDKNKVGAAKPVSQNLPVQPYSSLDASRLKIVGRGGWDLQAYLEDSLLWLPYVEPKILQHGQQIDRSQGPVLSREDPEECLRLAKLWDSQGLLGLVSEPPHDDAFTRIFNCYKSESHDRQIGDRRLANMTEYAVPGPSRFLPAGYMLTNLHVPSGHLVYGSISDRKDFYHQCAASRARSSTNVLPFAYDLEAFKDTVALDQFFAFEAAQPRSRELGGDYLGRARRSLLVDGTTKVFPCFNSLLQGDHGGVEYATQGHLSLLQDAGLLRAEVHLQGHKPLPLGNEWEGLVIDDYFALSVAKPRVPAQASISVQQVSTASVQYDAKGVIGSPEKDIIGSRHFKVVGAEVDASPKALSERKVLVGAPLQKRLAMCLLSLRVARLPVISTALASRLTGNWTSIFMFRRCLACVLSEIYAFCHVDGASEDDVFELPRSTADELVLASILGFIAVSDVSVAYHHEVFATDASMQKGAVVSRPVSPEVAKVLWLGGDKKGAYTALDPPFRELTRALGEDSEDVEMPGPPVVHASKWKSPEFSFDFIEVCAGVGSVSKELAKMGYSVAAPIELSGSQHFNITDCRLVTWLCNMLKHKKIRSIMVEPVCATFSPAAHPAVRSYDRPKGYDRLCPKTLRGNDIAFKCLFLVWYAATCGCPALCEQPRLSKMAWLSIWRFLVSSKNFAEAVVASCQFGSPHRKEFRMLGWGIDMESMTRKCPGGHSHIRIEGKWAKGSAIYVPALARHFATFIAAALRRVRTVESHAMDVRGLESVLCNDVLTTGQWKVELAWRWRSPSHINVLESSAFVSLSKLLLHQGDGDCRFSALLDSQVAKCSHAKGRSSAKALKPTLKKSAALQLAGGLYPAMNFAPTRLNTADAPSRDKEFHAMNMHSIASLADVKTLQKVHAVCLSRVAANWIRLVLLLVHLDCVHGLSWGDSIHASLSSGGLVGFLGFSFDFTVGALDFVGSAILKCCLETLGGLPWISSACSAPRTLAYGLVPIEVLSVHLPVVLWTCLFLHLLLHDAVRRGFGKLATPMVLVALIPLGNLPTGCFSGIHGLQPLPLCGLSLASAMPVLPTNPAEEDRASRRSGVKLFADRVVRPETRNRRDSLLEQFDRWLVQHAHVTLHELLHSSGFTPEQVSEYLVAYGKDLFYGGKSNGRFAETINGVASRRPVLRRQLVGAWDLAFSWVADEPARHHPAMPLTVLLAFASLCLLWGWPVEAAVLLLTWTGLLRIGEVFAAHRRDLILPEDGAPGMQFALLQIQQPKTRGVSAKHQAARIDPEDVVLLLSAVFGKWPAESRLWGSSPSTLRRRFATLLKSLGLPTTRGRDVTPYDLASLRPGGATHLLHRFEDAEFVRRRGRHSMYSLATAMVDEYGEKGGRAQQGAACGPRAISSDQLEGSAKVLLDLDLNTCSFSDLFENPGIDLESCEVPTAATGLVGWFDLHCCKDHPEVKMSTSPSAPKTHWLQCWMPFQKALNGESKCGKLHVKVQLRPQKLAGLPELCVALSGAQQALYFLDRGIVEYGDVPTFATEEPDFKRQRRAEDIEAIYFPSDVQELVRLAQQAVQEGAGPDA